MMNAEREEFQIDAFFSSPITHQIPLVNLLSTRYAEVLSVESSGSVGRVGVCAVHLHLRGTPVHVQVSRPPEGFDTLESAYLMRLGVPQPATQPTCAQLTLALR